MSAQHIMEALWGLLALVTTGMIFAAACILDPRDRAAKRE